MERRATDWGQVHDRKLQSVSTHTSNDLASGTAHDPSAKGYGHLGGCCWCLRCCSARRPQCPLLGGGGVLLQNAPVSPHPWAMLNVPQTDITGQTGKLKNRPQIKFKQTSEGFKLRKPKEFEAEQSCVRPGATEQVKASSEHVQDCGCVALVPCGLSGKFC